jgi:hypothetical protein
MLTKEQILRAKDIQTETVPVPEWGGDVLVRGLTGRERDEFEQGLVKGAGRKSQINLKLATARLCALSIVDEKGNRLFGDGDIMALNSKSSAALQRVYKTASRLSGLGDEDLEEMVKNSARTAGEDSSSD